LLFKANLSTIQKIKPAKRRPIIGKIIPSKVSK